VAEFVGTMNRVEATVADAERGEVELAGARVAVEAARGRRRGEPVLLLVRPETVEVEAAVDGAGLAGEVVSHTFLGAVTRVRVAVGEVEWSADLSSERAGALPVGARVQLRFPATSAQLLSLDRGGAPPAAGPDGR
jgi:putative spermidine/putrescine transport system ATP-binding protein